MTYYEQKGYDAFKNGESRNTSVRGSGGADYRRGWDAAKTEGTK
jgi:hypothetical protein